MIVLNAGLLVASLGLFFGAPETAQPLLSNSYNLARLAIILAALILTAYNLRSYWTADSLSNTNGFARLSTVNKLMIITPAIAIVFTLTQLFFPELAAQLVRKEDWPFYRNAIFVKFACQIIGLVAFVKIAKHYCRNKQLLPAILAVIMCLVFVVMAGEEMSWGQRVFKWSTPKSIAAGNTQNETNLHNFATQEFQNALYFGGWILLIALPFCRRAINPVLQRFKSLAFLTSWLPPLAFVLIFAVGFGFSDPLKSETGIYYSSNLFIMLGTLVALIALVVKGFKDDSTLAGKSLAITIAFIFIAICNLFFSDVWTHNAGAVTEYLEMFINAGFAWWAWGIYHSITHQSSNNTKPISASLAPRLH